MDLPSYIWLLLIFAALAFAALCVLTAYSLVRLRQLGQSVKEAGREMNEGIKSGQIEALKHAQDQMDRLSKSLVGLQSTLDDRLMGHQNLLTKQLTSSSETVAGIKKELGALVDFSFRFAGFHGTGRRDRTKMSLVAGYGTRWAGQGNEVSGSPQGDPKGS